MILLVSSSKDVASVNIARQILSQTQFDDAGSFQGNRAYETCISNKKVKLVTLNEESVRAQGLTGFFDDLELVVFVSRHRSESGTPTLSVHTPGNFSSAELGGIPRKVSISPANAMRNALHTMADLKDRMRLNYDVCYECTHHGPSLDAPAMFVELGSSAVQWNDLRAAEAVGRAAIEAILRFDAPKVRAVLGVGGPHYNAKFTRMALNDEIAFGHIIPKYAIAAIDVDILRQCVERTMEKVEQIILDRKGIRSEDKTALAKVLDDVGLPVQRV
jgi:D-aminoacyl-tRNA deacylase